MHEDEIPVTEETVRALVDDQFPRWRDVPVRRIASEGTVNAIFRIGTGWAARLPLQPGSDLEAEAAAMRELAAATSVPVPEPVALGEPGAGYPLRWSVQTWLPGRTASVQDPGGSVPFARDLAAFVREVRAIDPRGRTFDGRGRGGDLTASDRWMETCFAHSGHLLDVPRLRALWAGFRELPRTAADGMNHGDLVPGNVLVAAGRLAGVLDTGGLKAADPALDLVAAWHLLDEGPREVLRAGLRPDDLEWERGRAWAFEQAMGLPWYYERSNPAMAATGHRTLARVMGDRGLAPG